MADGTTRLTSAVMPKTCLERTKGSNDMHERSQRWRDRRDGFVPNATTIDPAIHSVDVIDCYRDAKPFVQRHHYSGSFPATRLSCGLFRNGAGGTSELVGVCSFAVPMNNASIPLHTGLSGHLSAVDLGRLVLLDDVAGNGESWFVSRAFRLLRREKPDILSVIAYSDPVRRIASDGSVVMPGHCGMVYQALSAQLRGRSSSRSDSIMPNGRIVSPRALSKIRSGDTGSAYAERQLVDAGAPPRLWGEDPQEWVSRLKRSGHLNTRRHPGNLVYAFALTKAARLAARGKPNHPYPLVDPTIVVGDVTTLPLMQAA